MPTRTIVVGSSVGLHARPAQIIAEAVAELDVEVFLGRPGEEPVDAGSALLVMTLGAGPGEAVEITCEDESVLARIASLVAQDLDAEGGPA